MKTFFCDLLVEARVSAGLTQREVAEKIGVSLNQYQKWEYAVIFPNGPTTLALLEALNMDPEEVREAMEYQMLEKGSQKS